MIYKMQSRPRLLSQGVLEKMVCRCGPITKDGAQASYIPILREADPSRLGICVADNAGRVLKAGDAEETFSIQSIVKIVTFTCSLLDSGMDRVQEKVSVEPTHDGFNSIINLATKNDSKPLNPMINAGSIACLPFVRGGTSAEKSNRIVDFVKKMAGNPDIYVDEDIFQSERSAGSRNRALAYYMKSTGVIESHVDVEELLEAYFRTCSIRLSSVDLAKIALVYANNGMNRTDGEELFPKEIARMIKATMVMCGVYDESGEVATRIGLPTKSGVGGGILSIVPNQMGIGIYGPALNAKGSSVAGLALLEMLSVYMDASIF